MTSAISISGVAPGQERVTPAEVVEFVRKHLDEAQLTGRVLTTHFKAPALG